MKNVFIWFTLTLSLGFNNLVRAAVTGQWDFNNDDLSARVGTALAYRGNTSSTTSFTTSMIGGEIAEVMQFPATSQSQGYIMTHGISPNGGGAYVNEYTLIMDVMFPVGSSGKWRSLFQTNPGNGNDGDLFVNPGNGIGISGVYDGTISADTWHRIAFVFDLTSPTEPLRKFIDGVRVGAQVSSFSLDGRWALEPTALLFADENNETQAGFVNSIQVQDVALSDSYIASLGGPTAAGIPPAATLVTYAQYDFDGNLASSSGGQALGTGFAAPAVGAGVTYSNVTINGNPAQVASFIRGSHFILAHGLGPNGGGNLLNQYTLIMDVMFPNRPSGWAVLYQTGPANTDDGDWFINPSQGVGISGNYSGLVSDGTWNRLALVVDNLAGTFTSYVNGKQVQQNAGLAPDGRWGLGPTVLLFADENQENAGGLVNSVQLRSTAMNAVDIAALGGAQASGIPMPQPPSSFQLLSPNGGEMFAAGTTQAIAWAAGKPSGLVQVELLITNLVFRTLGQALMRQSNFIWVIDPALGDTNNYRIRLTSLDFPSSQDISDADFTVTGSGVPPNLLFGQPLQLNGGFESFLTNWQVVAGQPVTFTSADGQAAPHGGSWFLHGGRNPAGDMLLRQDIDLLATGFTARDLDGGAAVDAEAWLRNAYPTWTFDSQVCLRIGFLDSSDLELASVRTMVAGNSVWTRRECEGLLPPGTRKLRLDIVGDHRRDADNHSMADDIMVRIQRVPLPVTPRLTKLPMLQDFRQDAMRLFWETDGNLAQHAVEWGRSDVAEHTLTQIETVQIDAGHFVHRATLTGPLPETRYVYRVRSGDAASATFSFRTAPLHDTPFAVAWWGDSQVGPGVLQQLIPSMLAHGVDWMGVVGDLVSSGASLYDWQTYWFGALEFRNIAQTHPALFARGNHDGEHPYCYAYSTLPGNGSWYAFDYGNSRFIFLDSEAPTGTSPEQHAWLQDELARPETQNAMFRVVCFHKLPYANLWNGGGYTGEPWVRSDWVPLFRQFNVDLVINGHAHNYNRGTTNGVTYTVVGGGGGVLDTERVAFWPLFTVEYSRYHYGLLEVGGSTLAWHAYDNSDQVLDSFTLPSRIPVLAWEASPAGTDAANLVVTGKPGTRYVLESSIDLVNWEAFATNTIPENGLPRFTNAVSAQAGSLSVRARTSQ
jgi:hypothetical protein